jgi:23S rRNA pseudouridine955/2504/2580 synthase
MELITGENDKDRRLDRILRKALPDYPLPLLHRLLRQKQVLVDGKPCNAQERIGCGAKISILGGSFKKTKKSAPAYRYTCSGNMPPLDILWEGDGLIAVNKPSGLAVHGTDSLDTIVNSYLLEKLPHSLSFKPGPLHRLDKPSSGIIVFSTTLEGARLFSSLMHEQKIRKTYLAVIEGVLEKEEIWQDKLLRDCQKKKTFVSKGASNSKVAITKVIPLSSNNNYTLIKAEIPTGRTHQIRAQAAFHGYPLAGDIKYGGKITKTHFLLHAWKIEFLGYIIEAPIPHGFETALNPCYNGK